MTTLAAVLEAHRAAVIDDCVKLIDAEVSDKSGISGLAIKAGFAAVKGLKPGFIKEAVTELLPEFASALEPLYQDARTRNVEVGAHFLSNRPKVAQALLGITDAKAKLSPSGVAKAAYERLRPAAERNVEAAVPRLAKLVSTYCPAPAARSS